MNHKETAGFDQYNRDRLISSGVGRRFWKKTLDDYSRASNLASDLRRLILTDLLHNSCIFIYGADSYDVANVYSKECVLAGKVCTVMTLSGLVDLIENPQQNSRHLYSADVIVLPRFFDASIAMPLSDKQRLYVEDILARRIDNNQIIVLGALSPLDSCNWWSKGFLGLLVRTALEIGV